MKELKKSGKFRLYKMALEVKNDKISTLQKERDELKANYEMLTIESDDILIELQALEDAVREHLKSKPFMFPEEFLKSKDKLQTLIK